MCAPQPLGRYGPYAFSDYTFVCYAYHHVMLLAATCMGFLCLQGSNGVTHSCLVLVGLCYICQLYGYISEHIHSTLFNNAHDVPPNLSS